MTWSTVILLYCSLTPAIRGRHTTQLSGRM